MISLISILREIKDKTITCKECGWHWKLSDGGKDPYTCHKCHPDNKLEEKKKNKRKGLWANIHANHEKGEKPSHGNSNAFKKAFKAAKDINKNS